MTAKITRKEEVAKKTLLVEFETEDEVNFKPGQYLEIALKNPPYTDEEGNKRYFSIVNSPNRKKTLSITTRLRDSAFKKSLNEFPLGTEVDITTIEGNFTLPQSSNQKLVFIAGGIGITPFMSMLRYIKEESLPHKITLLYSNRDKESTAYFDEIKAMADNNPDIKVIFTMTDDASWQSEKRRIDEEFIREYFPDLDSCVFMVAGPPGMVKGITESLKQAGVDEFKIKSEDFSGY